MNRTRGFTLIETMSAIAVGAVLLGMVARPAQNLLDRTRTTRASQLVASDLDMARGVAQRRHRPVRIRFDSTAMRYTVSDRATGAVLQARSIGSGSDLNVRAASFSPATVDVFPGGMTSSALTVSFSSGSASRRVTMSRAGMVRAP